MGNKRYPKKKALQRVWCVLWLENTKATKNFTIIYVQINVAIDVIGGLINECLIYFLLIGEISIGETSIGETSLFVVWQLENAI